jgi:uncharacterized membrane protein YfcA
MADLTPLAALFLAGVMAGTLNVLAGGGSFLTLPLLLFLGLPAAVANGTNRVGVFTQSLGAIWGFHTHRVLDWRWALGASVPAVAGAAIGAWAALSVSDVGFRRVLAVAMLAVTLWTLLGGDARTQARVRGPGHPLVVCGFFVVGLYGGFLQAGVGFLVLAVTTLAGMDLVRGNAVKMLTVLLLTVVSLLIFARGGVIDWPLGLALGVGNFAGGLLGVRLAVLRGHAWLQRVVTGAIILFAVLLWIT